MARRIPILIVGGGPVGLALAVGLGGRGITVASQNFIGPRASSNASTTEVLPWSCGGRSLSNSRGSEPLPGRTKP